MGAKPSAPKAEDAARLKSQVQEPFVLDVFAKTVMSWRFF